MSHLPLQPTQNSFSAKITEKKNGARDERRAKGEEHGQDGLRGVGYQSVRVGKKIGCESIFNFRLEQGKYSKNGRVSIKINDKNKTTGRRTTESRRILRINAKNQSKSIKITEKSNKYIYFNRIFGYNPIILNGMKGFRMSKNNIDLRKTATIDDIIDLENRLLGVRGILDAFSASLEVGIDNSEEALALVRDLITDTIIKKDIEMLKVKVEYVFGVCSDVYHGEVCDA